MRVVHGHDDAAADWAARRCGLPNGFLKPLTAIGGIDGSGRLVAAAVFNVYTGDDVEVTIVGRGINRPFLREIARHVFGQLGCARATATTRADNSKMQKHLVAGGFRREGVLRRKFGDCDGIVFGMLKEECRWYDGT